MHPKQNILILREDYNILENFGPHENEKSILKEQDIEGNHKNLINKSLDTKNYAKNDLLGCIPLDKRLSSKLLLSFKEVRFNKQEFPIGKPVSNIKSYYPGYENNNLCYPFND